MATATKTRKQTEITAATVNRVIDKATGKVLGYVVKSDSEQGVYYQVTWNREEHRYECTCPATKPCKHERAVSEVVKARKEIEAEQGAKQEDLRPQAEEVLMRLEAASHEMNTATDEEGYRRAERLFEALKGDLTAMGYPPLLTVRGWAINAPDRYAQPLKGSGVTGFRAAEIERKLAA